MLKKSLIGLGIGLGVLMLCSMLLVAGGVVGGMMVYYGDRYATRPELPAPAPEGSPRPQVWPEAPERRWRWPAPDPMLPEVTPPQLWGLVSAVLVTEVTPDSPADEAGVEVDDIIIAVDGTALGADHNLSETVRGHDSGDEIVLTIIRRADETEVFELEVTLGTNETEQGEVVTYLGIQYRNMGSPVRILPPGGGAWD